jgi:hypothetical protein
MLQAAKPILVAAILAMGSDYGLAQMQYIREKPVD